jgi:hypothetical protein
MNKLKASLYAIATVTSLTFADVGNDLLQLLLSATLVLSAYLIERFIKWCKLKIDEKLKLDELRNEKIIE